MYLKPLSNNPKMRCHMKTLFRRRKKCAMDRILQKLDDYGRYVGVPRLVAKKKALLLNRTSCSTVGFLDMNSVLFNKRAVVNDSGNEHHGHWGYLYTTYQLATQLNQLLPTAEDNGIYLTKEKRWKSKIKEGRWNQFLLKISPAIQ